MLFTILAILSGTAFLLFIVFGFLGVRKIKKCKQDSDLQAHAMDIMNDFILEQGYDPEQLFDANIDKPFVATARPYIPHVEKTSAMLEASKRYCYDVWQEAHGEGADEKELKAADTTGEIADNSSDVGESEKQA